MKYRVTYYNCSGDSALMDGKPTIHESIELAAADTIKKLGIIRSHSEKEMIKFQTEEPQEYENEQEKIEELEACKEFTSCRDLELIFRDYRSQWDMTCEWFPVQEWSTGGGQLDWHYILIEIMIDGMHIMKSYAEPIQDELENEILDKPGGV